MIRKLKRVICGGFKNIPLQYFFGFTLFWATMYFVTDHSNRMIIKHTTKHSNLSAENNLAHFNRSTNLRRYLQNIRIIIEPLGDYCSDSGEVQVIVLVASTMKRRNYRTVIRKTWGKHMPTCFVLGLNANTSLHQMSELKSEAMLFQDMIVFSLIDHYQNLTIKTTLMLSWTSFRCPQARFLYKVDDDMFVNPWMLKEVIENHTDSRLIGYVAKNKTVLRDVNEKRYLPRRLFPEDTIPQYIIGGGYLINGNYINSLLNAALHVRLINIEDIYVTYMVAHKTLEYELTHDRRMSPYRFWIVPWWLPIIKLEENYACIYWSFASLHNIEAEEILKIWPKIEEKGAKYRKGEAVCEFYMKHLSRLYSLAILTECKWKWIVQSSEQEKMEPRSNFRFSDINAGEIPARQYWLLDLQEY